MNLSRLGIAALLAYCPLIWAIPGMLNAEEDWLHSLPRQCLLKKQSHFDQEIAIKAEKGDVNAQYQLALSLLTGLGLPKDLPQAYRWMLKAAQGGQIRAQLALASMYRHGEGVTASLTDAAYWYQHAAQAGDEEAKYAHALMQFFGDGMPQNQLKATQCLIDLANHDFVSAQTRLGEMMLQQAKQDPLKAREAVTWLKRAEANGSDNASYLLVLAHIQQTPKEPLSEEKIMWLTHGANDGDVKKQYLLGMVYRYGVGVNQNFALAKEYLQKAAASGNESATILLGTMPE